MTHMGGCLLQVRGEGGGGKGWGTLGVEQGGRGQLGVAVVTKVLFQGAILTRRLNLCPAGGVVRGGVRGKGEPQPIVMM